MTFLNPLVLFGLAAAAIPVILHLINLRRLRTIEFSTLSFLKELQHTRIRRLKLRQLLLLILRTLLILLLVLAFARPTIRGALAGSGGQAASTAVILIDDSMSMTASDQQGVYLTQAKEAALRILGLMNDGDEVALVKLSDVSRGTDPSVLTPLRDLGIIRSRIQDITSSPVHRHIEEGLRRVAGIMSFSHNFNKEVYVISDFQEGVIAPEYSREPQREQRYPSDVRFFLLPVGTKDLQNFGVESASVQSSIIEVNRPFLLKVKVGNNSAANVSNQMVSVFLNGTRVAQKGIDALSGQTIETEFSLIPRTHGFLDGFVELEDDDLSYDNRFYFSLHLPEVTRILLVGTAADTRYLRLALATRTDAASLRIQHASYDRLAASMLTDQDVLVLANPGTVPSFMADQIAAFVRHGGGLLVFPGPASNPAAFKASFASLNLPELRGIESLSGAREQSSYVGIETAELRHPLFEGMFEPAPGGTGRTAPLESPHITTFARFVPNADATVIVTMSNDAPFFLEVRRGNGRVLLCSVPATLEWSDFPLKGLFVPLLHRSISYLTQERIKQQSVYAGDPVTIQVPAIGGNRMSVRTPNGLDVDLIPTRSGTSVYSVFRETLQPGIYTVRDNSTVERKFAVNMDPDESRTQRAAEASIRTMFDRLGIAPTSVTTIKNIPQTDRVVLQSRFGIELWKYLLMAALVIAIAEMLVARDSRRSLDAARGGNS